MVAKVKITKAKHSELLAIANYDHCNNATPWSYKLYCEAYLNERYKIFLLKEEQIIGVIVLYNLVDEIEIQQFFIIHKYQNMGYGKILLKKIFALFSLETVFFLEVSQNNFKALKLYQNFDFKIINIRKNYYAYNNNALILKRQILIS